MAIKLNLDYKPFRDGQLDEMAELAGSIMEGNPQYQQVAGKVTHMTAVQKDYHQSLVTARRGGQDAHMAKDGHRKALEVALSDLAFSCNLAYPGDRTLLEGTTLPMSQANGRRQSKEPVTLAIGHRSITIALKKDPDADTWLLRYTEAPVTEGSTWTELYINRSPITINNLVTDQRYAICLAPIYHLETPEFGDPLISRRVD